MMKRPSVGSLPIGIALVCFLTKATIDVVGLSLPDTNNQLAVRTLTAASKLPPLHGRVLRHPSLLLEMTGDGNNNQMDNTESDDKEDNRSEGLRKVLVSLGEVADTENGGTIRVGSTVVAGNSIPNLCIWQFQSYELQSIYDQGINDETGMVEKVPRESLDAPMTQPSYTRYVRLFSKKHHGGKNGMGPVVISPDEVELSSLQTEVVDSVVMALPLFGFWTALAFSFANQYSERTGGTFVDALLGR